MAGTNFRNVLASTREEPGRQYIGDLSVDPNVRVDFIEAVFL